MSRAHQQLVTFHRHLGINQPSRGPSLAHAWREGGANGYLSRFWGKDGAIWHAEPRSIRGLGTAGRRRHRGGLAGPSSRSVAR